MRMTIEIEYLPPAEPDLFKEWMGRNMTKEIDLVDHLDTGGFVIRVRMTNLTIQAGVATVFQHLNRWFAEAPAIHQLMEPVGVRATRNDTTDRIAELVGTHEIANLLGVSRQRVAQLAKTARFPSPVARLAMGPVYTRRSIIRFCRITGRPLYKRTARRPNGTAAVRAGTSDVHRL